MKIESNKVVLMHYTLKNKNGDVIDTSEGREAMAFIQGVGHIIPGLEKELEGRGSGDKVATVVTPEEGYGLRSDENVHQVPLANFKSEGDEKLEAGMQVQVETNQGASVAMVAAIEDDLVTLDMNHPLAGETLHFNVEIVEVRDATSEELEHGHVHGPGGHQH
jgi:FKBP-type peptidyl-prolyl cis-trans isomerase SlyD